MTGDVAPRHPGQGTGLVERARACLRVDCLVVALVIAVTIFVAVKIFFSYWPSADLLWRGVHHDRNGHYLFGLDLAVSVRHADVVGFFQTLARSTIWPPVHGLALAAVLLVGGFDHRLGILPSLTGWTLTVVFAALLAHRLAGGTGRGEIDKTNPARDGSGAPAIGRIYKTNPVRDRDGAPTLLAAVVAMGFTMASPAFRLLGTDVMLEALGAGLSAWALWAFARAMEAPDDRGRWRTLALVLTALFFEKGNYWGLVLAALMVAAAGAETRRVIAGQRAVAAALRLGDLARALWRDPLILLALALTLLIGVLYARGPSALVLFGRTLNLYPPENLTTIAYAFAFWRAALVWRRHRAALDAALGTPGRALFYWQVVPVAVSFLVPKRLSAFIWFVGPANRHPGEAYDLAASLYGNWVAFADAFHPERALAILALVLFALGLTRARRSAGHRAVFALALIATVAVVIHPQQQGRFLASWVFAWWIGAGIGAGALLDWATARLAPPLRLAAAALAALAFAAAVFTAIPPRPSTFVYEVAIRATSGPSDMELVRPVFPTLDGTEPVGVATTFGKSSFIAWALRERCRCRREVDAPWLTGLGSRDQAHRVMNDYLATAGVGRLLIIDAPDSPYAAPEPGGGYPTLAGVLDALALQTRFVRVAAVAVPAHGATVSVWRRVDVAQGSPDAAPALASR